MHFIPSQQSIKIGTNMHGTGGWMAGERKQWEATGVDLQLIHYKHLKQ